METLLASGQQQGVHAQTPLPLYVSHDPSSGAPDRIVIEIEAEMRDYFVQRATGKVAEGDKTLGTSTTVWSFVHEDGRWLLTNIEPEGTAFE